MPLTSKTKLWAVFGFSVFVGAFVWIASPLLTGQREPWDSPGLSYPGTLVIGGFLAGIVVPRKFWLWALGIWCGQMIGFAWGMITAPESGAEALASLGFFYVLPRTSLWGLVGSGIGAGIGYLGRLLLEKKPKSSEPMT
jgi:hypothetical protein